MSQSGARCTHTLLVYPGEQAVEGEARPARRVETPPEKTQPGSTHSFHNKSLPTGAASSCSLLGSSAAPPVRGGGPNVGSSDSSIKAGDRTDAD